MSFTDKDTVRATSAMAGASVSGKVKDEQIDAAIPFAETELRKTIGDYDTVLAYSNSSTAAQIKQKAAYKIAESCFALGFVAKILTSAQLAASGFVKTIDIGKETRTFVSDSDRDQVIGMWRTMAMDKLRDYLETDRTDEDTGEVVGFDSKDRKLSFTVI